MPLRCEKRCEMRPGTILVASTDWAGGPPRHAYVVINAKNEVEFFTGARAVYGEVAPAVFFEVLS